MAERPEFYDGDDDKAHLKFQQWRHRTTKTATSSITEALITQYCTVFFVRSIYVTRGMSAKSGAI
jgi:hypothetical protein